MRDAVAEVLLERRALSKANLPLGVIASAVLHITVVVVAAIVMRLQATHTIKPPTVTVRLASPSSFKQTAPSRPATTKPVAPAQAETKPVPIEAPKAEPPPVETKPDKKKPVEESVFGRSKDKPSAKPTPNAGSVAPSPVAAQPASMATVLSQGALPAIGTAGISGLEGGDFPYTVYLERMITLIGTHWFRPASSGENSVAVVHFVIERDGRIRDVEIVRTSGNTLFDRAAQRSLIETSPLPPLPFGYSGTFLGVHLTFH